MIDNIVERVSAAVAQHPNLSFAVLVPTPEGAAACRAAGLEPVEAHTNAFVDERVFFPQYRGRRRFDAVYNARFLDYKRHHLAAAVPRLALISLPLGVAPEQAAAVTGGMSDLSYSNFDAAAGVLRGLDNHHVRRVLARACTGLALSAVEGGMYASAEYLLTGLPVVTTPSRGDRDVFFHPDYVLTVEPTPEAVAAGVAELKARQLDPLMIRERTLELMRPHRLRLLEHLKGVTGLDFVRLAGPSAWAPQFTNKLVTMIEADV